MTELFVYVVAHLFDYAFFLDFRYILDALQPVHLL